MHRLVVLAAGLATAAGLALGLAPASATCMDTFDKGGVHIYSCSPPGGPATTYICVGDICTTS